MQKRGSSVKQMTGYTLLDNLDNLSSRGKATWISVENRERGKQILFLGVVNMQK